jgi:hypothetical protein
LKLGVNPEILKVRDIDSFWEPGGMEPVVQRMRHEAYVQRRHDTMKQCRIERKRITNALFEASGAVDATGEEMTPDMVLQKQKAQSSTLIQMEMQKIVKMQQRQEKELGQMIQVSLSLFLSFSPRFIFSRRFTVMSHFSNAITITAIITAIFLFHFTHCQFPYLRALAILQDGLHHVHLLILTSCTFLTLV